ncbi:MAG TPA: glutamate racemase [Acidisarcina sp.]
MSLQIVHPLTTPQLDSSRQRIGVFDSGVGGLTVLRAMLPLLPAADFLYVGDTARLPYGSKSRATIARYAVSSTRFLVEQGAEFLVIACNTASALAIDEIRDAAGRVPVLGVIETGAAEARATSKTGDVLVIATDATVQSHAYDHASRAVGLRALEQACPLLVPLVEEGWIDHPVTAEVLRIYLSDLLAASRDNLLAPDTLVLGCTHYPLLRGPIERALTQLTGELHHGPIRVIDSAEATATRVASALKVPRSPAHSLPGGAGATMRFFATDSVSKFRTLGARFLGRPIGEVELVDLGG